MADTIKDTMARGLAVDDRLSLTVRLDDEEKRDAPLGLDVAVLDAILFVGGTAEFLYWYASDLAGETSGLPYASTVFREFERDLAEVLAGHPANWMELYEFRQQACYRLFLRYLMRRDGGARAMAAGGIVRLELVRAWKENPSFRTIIASGVAGAMMIISSTFASVQIMREHDRKQCIEQAYDYGNRQAALLAKTGKFEGKLPQDSYGRVQDVVNARIAACGSPLTGIGVKAGPGGVALEASSKPQHPEK